jgi:hypothetical protein
MDERWKKKEESGKTTHLAFSELRHRRNLLLHLHSNVLHALSVLTSTAVSDESGGTDPGG